MKFCYTACLATALLIGFSAVASAKDLKKGTFQLTGSTAALFGTSSETANGDDRTDTDVFDIKIGGSYHVADNLGLGLMLKYRETDFDDSYSVTETLVGPMAQLSIPLNEITNFWIGAGFGYTAEEVDADDAQFDYGLYGLFYTAQAGVSLFPISNVSVDIGVSYLNQSREEVGVDLERETIAGNIGLSIYF